MIKTLFVFFLIYLLFRFLRFFFTAFMVMSKQRRQFKTMADYLRNMQQQQQHGRQPRREGEVAIDYIPEEKQKPEEKPKQKGGEYVDYEVVK